MTVVAVDGVVGGRWACGASHRMAAAYQRWLDSQPVAPTLTSLANERIAVCMVGAARTLLLPAVYHSVKKNLLDAQLVPTDLFVHLHLSWDSTKYRHGMGHHGAGGAIVHSANDPRLRSVLEQLHPVDISIITTSGCENKEMATLPVCEQLRRGSVFTLPRPDRHGLNSSYTPANLIKLPSAGELAGYLQFMWVHRALLKVIAYERSHRGGREYAWVIRTRPDLAFFDRVPAAIAMNTRRAVLMEKESNPAFFDGFWMAPRQLLPVMADGIDEFWHTRPHLPWPPEWAFFPWIRDSKRLAWGFALIPAVLVRTEAHADCWRLATKETPQFLYEMQGTAWGRAPLEVREKPDVSSSPNASSAANTSGAGVDDRDVERAEKRRFSPQLVQHGGPLISFRTACEQFFGMTRNSRRKDLARVVGFQLPNGGGAKARARSSDFFTGGRMPNTFTAHLKPLLLRKAGSAPRPAEECHKASEWSVATGNVPTPLNAERCDVRYASFDEAARACCAEALCDAVVRDGGLWCPPPGGRLVPGRPPGTNGGKMRMIFELRKGLTSVQFAMVRRIQPPDHDCSPLFADSPQARCDVARVSPPEGSPEGISAGRAQATQHLRGPAFNTGAAPDLMGHARAVLRGPTM